MTGCEVPASTLLARRGLAPTLTALWASTHGTCPLANAYIFVFIWRV